MVDNNLQLLDQGLDETSYYWLEDNYPQILAGIEDGLKNGASIDEIRRRVKDRTGRTDLARRCEQAARHVAQIDREIAFEELRAMTTAMTSGFEISTSTDKKPKKKKGWFGATPVKTGIQPEQVETGLEAIKKEAT